MSNFYSVLGEDDIGQEGEQKLVDFFRFKSLMPNVKVLLPNSNFQRNKSKTSSSLLECSSKYGYFVAGSCTGFVLGQTAKLRSKVLAASKAETVAFDEIISVDIADGEVNIIVLSADQLQLFVGVSGGLLLTFNIRDIIKNRENALPVQSQSMGGEITFIKPNPEAYPDILAVCTKNNELRLVRYLQKQVISTIYNITSLCWSPKGKQIICGTKDGTLYAYDIEGNPKDEIQAPPAVQSDHYVNAILWIENHVFLAVYANSKGEEHTHSAYMINRRESEDKKYILMDEINPIFDSDAPDSYFYLSILPKLGPGIQNLIVIANAGANELAVIGQDEEGAWATWMLDEASMPRLPLSEDGVSDTYPVGLALDLSASEPLEPYDAAESETPVPAMPVLYFLTNEGSICAYHAYNIELAKKGDRYQYMVEAQNVDEISAPAVSFVSSSEPKTSSSAPTFSEHKSSFGNTATKIPSFNSMMSTSKSATTQPTSPSPFATSSSEAPKFGSTSSIGLGFGVGSPSQKQAVPFASLTRSSSSETKLPTAFGSSPSFGTPSFGSTSFGTGNETPTFGSTTSFGAGGFGSKSTFKTAPAAPPSFGGFKNVTSPRPFGDVSFKTDNDAATTKFAPSTLEVKTEDDKQKKPVEAEKSTALFAPPTLNSKNDKKPLTAREARKEEEIKKKPADHDQAKKEALALDAQPVDKEYSDVDVPSKKSTPTEPTSCNMSFEEIQKTLEADDTSSDISRASIIRDSGDDNSENDYSQRDDSSNGREELEKEEQRELEMKKKALVEKQIEKEKSEEAERLVEEKRLEAERIAEEERLATIKRDPLFAVRESRQHEPTIYKRTPDIPPMAKNFEEDYFKTLEDMESTCAIITEIKDELAFQKRTAFALKDTSYLEDLDFVWKLSDNRDISGMMDALIQEAEEADVHLKQIQTLFDNLCEATDRLAIKKDILVSCTDTKQIKEAIKDVDLDNDIISQYSELEAKNTETKKNLDELQTKLEECKSKLVHKPTTTASSNLSLYTLRRTVRDIEHTIAKEKTKLMAMKEEELKLHKKEENSSTCTSDNLPAEKLSPLKKHQSKSHFLNLVFQGAKQPLHS